VGGASGLNEGERVIVAGVHKAQPGILVRAVRRLSDGSGANNMAKFFIDRPIFAIVIANLIMVAGGALSISRCDRAVSRRSRRPRCR